MGHGYFHIFPLAYPDKRKQKDIFRKCRLCGKRFMNNGDDRCPACRTLIRKQETSVNED